MGREQLTRHDSRVDSTEWTCEYFQNGATDREIRFQWPAARLPALMRKAISAADERGPITHSLAKGRQLDVARR